MANRGEHLVRIRIFRIIGFSGFYYPVFERQALIRAMLFSNDGFVRIRIFKIIGFTGFYYPVFKLQALIRIRLGRGL